MMDQIGTVVDERIDSRQQRQQKPVADRAPQGPGFGFQPEKGSFRTRMTAAAAAPPLTSIPSLATTDDDDCKKIDKIFDPITPGRETEQLKRFQYADTRIVSLVREHLNLININVDKKLEMDRNKLLAGSLSKFSLETSSQRVMRTGLAQTKDALAALEEMLFWLEESDVKDPSWMRRYFQGMHDVVLALKLGIAPCELTLLKGGNLPLSTIQMFLGRYKRDSSSFEMAGADVLRVGFAGPAPPPKSPKKSLVSDYKS